ncbi:MAG: hypothetical protein Q9187_002205 [Circinaria calcarea]
MSRRKIEGLIAEGRAIIIVDGKVLKVYLVTLIKTGRNLTLGRQVDTWLRYYPGGDKAIMHMVGRDATDEVNALHSPEAQLRMDAYQIGSIRGRWTNFLPPIQGGRFRPFEEEEDRVEDEGEGEVVSVQESSSHSTSLSNSPVFDTMIFGSEGIRRRNEQHMADDDASSISSFSSLDITGIDEEDKKVHLDSHTQRELELDLAKYPRLDPVTQDDITRRYRALDQRIRLEGLYQCNYTSYLVEICRYTFLFSMFLLSLRRGWYALSGLFLGMFWHQLVFTAHDAGHMGITHNFTVDTIIGIVIADFLGGLSLGWWKRNHNVHHIVTNSPEHDPDIEHMPFLAISHRFFESLRSTYYDRIMTYDTLAKFAVRYQKYLYYPILTLGRFNLYRLSWEYLILGLGPRKGPAWWHRWLEIAGQVFFWT